MIYAFGAGTDKRLGIPGEDLPGSVAAPDFVAWYCGHPDVHPDTDRDTGGESNSAEATPREQHRQLSDLVARSTSAVVVGVGNVALDVARVLIKYADQLADTDMADEVLASLAAKQVTDVHVLGRRGPAYTAFTTKELRELGQLPGVDVIVDPQDLELDGPARPSSPRTRSRRATSPCCGISPRRSAGRPSGGSSCTFGPDPYG